MNEEEVWVSFANSAEEYGTVMRMNSLVHDYGLCLKSYLVKHNLVEKSFDLGKFELDHKAYSGTFRDISNKLLDKVLEANPKFNDLINDYRQKHPQHYDTLITRMSNAGVSILQPFVLGGYFD
jgi:hypothetical protein